MRTSTKPNNSIKEKTIPAWEKLRKMGVINDFDFTSDGEEELVTLRLNKLFFNCL